MREINYLRRHFAKGVMRVISRAIGRLLAKDSISGGKRKMIIDRALWALSPYEMRNDGIVENAL